MLPSHGRGSVEHLVRPLGVVEAEPCADPASRLTQVLVCFQVYLLVLERPPQPLNVFTASVRDHAEKGSGISTGGWVSYGSLMDDGYRHNDKVGAKLPIIHRECANLNTWLQGTHHGRIERQHLQAYLN